MDTRGRMRALAGLVSLTLGLSSGPGTLASAAAPGDCSVSPTILWAAPFTGFPVKLGEYAGHGPGSAGLRAILQCDASGSQVVYVNAYFGEEQFNIAMDGAVPALAGLGLDPQQVPVLAYCAADANSGGIPEAVRADQCADTEPTSPDNSSSIGLTGPSRRLKCVPIRRSPSSLSHSTTFETCQGEDGLAIELHDVSGYMFANVMFPPDIFTQVDFTNADRQVVRLPSDARALAGSELVIERVENGVFDVSIIRR